MLRVDGVAMAFDGLQALSDCSFTVREHCVTGLVGANGAGKTTMFNIISGTLSPDRGRIILRDRDITRMSSQDRVRQGIGRTFQDVRLFRELSALENVLVGVQDNLGEGFLNVFVRPRTVLQRDRAAHAYALECLEYAGFPTSRADVRASDFSYAEQKLISIARLLATRSNLLLLDEPVSGLDEPSIEHLKSLLRRLVGDGKTVLLVEHNMLVVRELADWVVFLGAGRVLADDVPERVLARRELQEAYFGVAA